jgi:hypothetical protein
MDNIDLISGNYIMTTWPEGKIHSYNFPYLLIRVAFGVYSLIAISKEVVDNDIDGLLDDCLKAGAASGYRACLVVSESKCFYIEPDGKTVENNNPPTGGSIINWQKFVNGMIKRVDLENGRAMFYTEDSPGKMSIIYPSV